MMTAEQLRGAILKLAMQGKLVEQRPEEGTGEELYQKIQAENNSVTKKTLSFTDDEVIDIPESWKLVRLENIAILHNGRAYKQKELLDCGKYAVLRVGNLFTNNQWYYSDMELDPDKYCDKGDLLYSWSASFGPHIWSGDKVIYHYHIWKIVFSKWIDKYFLYYYLLADTDRIKKSGHGLAMIHVTKAGTEKRVIPLPPLEEQKRIVAKIEELMPFVDQYAVVSTKLNALNANFPDMMKKSILQEAVQGKLVPQDPNDEPASALLKKIAEEKKRLIKEGKIKKQKALPEITEDEIPFEIPESWEWVRLQDLTELITKGSSPKWQGINYVEEGLLFVTSENVGVNKLLWSNKKYVEYRFNDISPRSILRKGDLLTNIVGASIGRTAVYDLDAVANINQAVCLIRLINQDLAPYILMHLNSPIAYRIMMSDKVETARPNISLTNIAEFLVPLPPLEEQKRIIEKLTIVDEPIRLWFEN